MKYFLIALLILCLAFPVVATEKTGSGGSPPGGGGIAVLGDQGEYVEAATWSIADFVVDFQLFLRNLF